MKKTESGAGRNPRILIVTPEITYLPPGMGNMADHLSAKAGGMADVSASLVSALFERGADVHVALPHYRKMFHVETANLIESELRRYYSVLSNSRIHLANDRLFHYRDTVYDSYSETNPRIALVFQREVINNIIPAIRPDLIHCNDWMTGLVPGFARRLGIPSLFTVHNIHTHDITLERAEETGIDCAEFWQNLYYKRQPENYEETRSRNQVDLLASGIFAAHYINTVSPSFLREIVDGKHFFVPPQIRKEIASKFFAGCAEGILNAPDANYNPATDDALPVKYETKHGAARSAAATQLATPAEGRLWAKRALQEHLSLDINDDAPVLFWPSRLDPAQKGCQLLSDILYRVVSKYWDDGLQVVFVANGAFQRVFHDIVSFHNFPNRVAVADFNENLSRLAYAGSDFTLMPSLFEPCGLPQMVGPIYGSLPIVHNTGGLKDTVAHMDPTANGGNGAGNGFVFNDYDSSALMWAIDEAVRFHKMPAVLREAQRERVMSEASKRFNHGAVAETYMAMYEKMLNRPLV